MPCCVVQLGAQSTGTAAHLLSQKLNTGSSSSPWSTMLVKGGTTPFTLIAGKPMPCGTSPGKDSDYIWPFTNHKLCTHTLIGYSMYQMQRIAVGHEPCTQELQQRRNILTCFQASAVAVRRAAATRTHQDAVKLGRHKRETRLVHRLCKALLLHLHPKYQVTHVLNVCIPCARDTISMCTGAS